MQQPMSHDAYQRTTNQEHWVEKTGTGQNPYEQEDQWAILRHEVEGGNIPAPEEHVGTAREQRNTEEDTQKHRVLLSEQDALMEAQHHVDIVVAGVGGGGMNAINRMIATKVRGVRFIAMNTDAQVLALSSASHRICLGQHHTRGLGAGGNSAVGMRAATESTAEIRAALGDADLVFIAAGMGGGTGTGAAPIIASIAKKLGALTIGIVTLPFSFEGTRRRRVAEQGLTELAAEIDALITVPNDRLLSTIARDQNLSEAFKVADDVLRQGVQGIAEVINVPGMINVDFADVRSVLREAGTALMSIGQGSGRNRAQRAAEEAIAGGFLNVTIRGARRVLFNISGGEDMTLFEVNEIAERIGESIDNAADITFGAVIDPSLSDTLRVTLIAAGMEELHTLHMPAIYTERTPQQARMTGTGGRNAQPTQQSSPPIAPLPSRSTPAEPARPAPMTPPPTRLPPPLHPASPPPGRLQRSLDDLRGLRNMGRRHEEAKRRNDQDDESIDVPPFLKRYDR
ncbi:MAG: cell division protein FtsZ [Ktedonobacteraceae bacterium]|nr:cell division protein FtsZ [Ktedonobacteraceae bacterium]